LLVFSIDKIKSKKEGEKMKNKQTQHNIITAILKMDSWNNNKIWTSEQKQQIIDNIQQIQ
jgi:hypothetical protein